MRTPFHPLLIAAFPIIFLVAHNRDKITGAEAIVPLTMTAVAVALALAAGRRVFRSAKKAAIVTSVAALLFFSYGHVWALLEGTAIGRDRVLVPSFAAVGLGTTWAVARTHRLLTDATRVLNAVSVGLVLVVVIPLVPYLPIGSARDSTDHIGATLRPADPARDIYYLIFDRYADTETLEEHFGFDNRPFIASLEDRGFVVADQSRANYQSTHHSLASSLNLDHLEALTPHVERPSSDTRPIFDLISHNAVGTLLQDAGYRYIHIGSWPEFTATSDIADVNLKSSGTSEFMQVLYDSTALSILSRRLTDAGPPNLSTAQRDATREQLTALDETMSLPGPKFVFAHVIPPHPPYVFDRDGNASMETQRKGNVHGYLEQVRFVNSEILRIVDLLLAAPEDRAPIVIIQSDEGPIPHLSERFPDDWTDEPIGDVRVKFGILNAYHLPGENDAVYPSISPVNSFRVVFNRYFGTDLPLLRDESYAAVSHDDIYSYSPLGDRVHGPPSSFTPPGS